MSAASFLGTRYRAIAGVRDAGHHWLGGKPLSDDANCPVCRIPLLLLWDIDCQDARFEQGKFGQLVRLPLYFCWGCVSDLAYQPLADTGVNFFATSVMRSGPDFPYDGYPDCFERRPLSFVAESPETPKKLLADWNPQVDPIGRRLKKAHGRALAEYFGHPVSTALCLCYSQLGGTPLKHWWGEELTTCPNPDCSGKKGQRGNEMMSFLAGVLNDPLKGLPMIQSPAEVTNDWWNYLISVEFQICESCFAIYARNRSD